MATTVYRARDLITEDALQSSEAYDEPLQEADYLVPAYEGGAPVAGSEQST